MKKIKYNILVATNHLDTIGGTETYTYALIEELKNMGHNVEYYTLKKGYTSERIEKKLGVKFMKNERYDLILANHNSIVEKIRKKGFIIQTCHGIYPYLEQPSLYANAYVAISNEVQEHLANKGLNSFIIPNGINCKRFYIKNPCKKKPKKILSLCQSEIANNKLQKACNNLNIQLVKYQQFGGKIWDIENYINQVDIVVGLGRSAYDAMACGRPVIVYDERAYMEPVGDGYVMPVLTESFSKNCSGRFYKRKFEVNDLITEIQKYKKEDSFLLRNFAFNYLNISKTTSAYIEIFERMKKKTLKSKIIDTLSSYSHGKLFMHALGKKIY